MTAPRAREHAGPPSPPDRRPPRRGGGSSPSPYRCASAAGRPAGPARLCGARRGLVRSARALAAAALLALSGALALPAPAQADVLVSNFGQTDDVDSAVASLAHEYAQGFDPPVRTRRLQPRPASNCWILCPTRSRHVVGDGLRLRIRAGDSGATAICTLIIRRRCPYRERKRRSPPRGATLEASTDFIVVVSHTSVGPRSWNLERNESNRLHDTGRGMGYR